MENVFIPGPSVAEPVGSLSVCLRRLDPGESAGFGISELSVNVEGLCCFSDHRLPAQPLSRWSDENSAVYSDFLGLQGQATANWGA